MKVRVKKKWKTVWRPSNLENAMEELIEFWLVRDKYKEERTKRAENLALYWTTHPELENINRKEDFTWLNIE